jgi:predicted nucleotidyltransferase component of viral defense system
MTTETFLSLSLVERTEALQVAASKSGRPLHVLEKDVWAVWTLSALFDSPFGPHLVFKGGTSLSKAYNAINRFSEDIDVTYDIRQLLDKLVTSETCIATPRISFPRSPSQQPRHASCALSELLGKK